MWVRLSFSRTTSHEMARLVYARRARKRTLHHGEAVDQDHEHQRRDHQPIITPRRVMMMDPLERPFSGMFRSRVAAARWVLTTNEKYGMRSL